MLDAIKEFLNGEITLQAFVDLVNVIMNKIFDLVKDEQGWA